MLCYLEGLTTEAAARRLGCAQGTVMSRLSRARERLRQRLTRRGLAPAVGLLTAGLSADAAQGGRTGRDGSFRGPGCDANGGGHDGSRGGPGDGRRPHRRSAEDDGPFQAQGNRGGRPGCRRAHRRDGDARLSDGGSPAARGTGGRDRNGGVPVSREDDPSRTEKGSAGELVVRAADQSRNRRRKTDSWASLPSTRRRRNGGRSIRGSPSALAPSPRTAATWSPQSLAWSRTRRRPASGSTT